ncbi:hypothetical protein AGLY_010104 [Aphis glycines]|uniref:Odorant receptor n=1 Tax=Aphis glycines TaxID=307491 RepID=A0A6G0TF80_APHGL|nr:hypothetical protein AGLY_010104 [Aphis glycines]
MIYHLSESQLISPNKPHTMDGFNEQNILINFNIFKELQFYQIFYSSGIKIFGLNTHQLFYIFYALVALCIKSYGISTLFSTNCKFLSYIDYFIIFYVVNQMYLSFWKLFKCLNDRNRLLDLFKIAQLNFLTSEECTKYSKVLYKHRDKNSKFVNYYLIFSFVVILQWFIFPIVINQILYFENSNVRAQNIINLCFGVATLTYNKFVLIFYLLEIIVTSLTVYILIMMDTLIISLCSAIIYHQEVLIYAFKNIGYEDNPKIIQIFTKSVENAKICKRINPFGDYEYSLLEELIRINENKIILFYNKINNSIDRWYRFILFNILHVLIHFVKKSFKKTCHGGVQHTNPLCHYTTAIVYHLNKVCMTPGSDTVLTLIKIGSTVLYITARLFIYCYLFDSINKKRELVNYSIYCCNWTKMDLKFKKLLLLTLQMNDANRMVIKASPRKIINLQLFASSEYNSLLNYLPFKKT